MITLGSASRPQDPEGDLVFAIAESLLLPRGWKSCTCAACGRPLLADPSRDTCQSITCSQPPRRARGKPRRASLGSVWEALRAGFGQRDHATRRRDDLRNSHGQPLFVIAAIQNFDPEVYLRAPIPEGPFLIAQPSMRFRYFDAVGQPEGVGTAFVNIGSYQFGASADIYRTHLAGWLSALTGVGLDRQGFTLTLERVDFDAGPYRGRYLIVNHGGIELGEAIYISHVSLAGGGSTTMVDFGFGLERIAWAVAGTAAYHRNIGPIMGRVDDDAAFVDSARCATLLAMSGITPSNKAHGYRMRITAARLARVLGRRDLGCAVRDCYEEWLPFIDPVRDADDCIDVLKREIERQRVLDLARELGVKESWAVRRATERDCIADLLVAGWSIDDLCERRAKENGKPIA